MVLAVLPGSCFTFLWGTFALEAAVVMEAGAGGIGAEFVGET